MSVKVVQCDINTVGGCGNALPILPTIVFGLTEATANESGHQGNQEACGSHVDVVANVENSLGVR